MRHKLDLSEYQQAQCYFPVLVGQINILNEVIVPYFKYFRFLNYEGRL